MKNLLKFVGVLALLVAWIELIDVSFWLMNQSDDMLFYVGFLTLALITTGPIIYFGDNIIIFLRNMRGVFFDKEKKE